MDYKQYIRNWPDTPRSDLTHILAQRDVFTALIEELAAPFVGLGVTHVASVDAGGFALGGGVAHRLHAGVVLIRKAGKIDWGVGSVTCVDFSGTEKVLEIANDAVSASDRVLVVDDWSETGAQLHAAMQLIEHLGARVFGGACLHIGPAARAKPELSHQKLHDLIRY